MSIIWLLEGSEQTAQEPMPCLAASLVYEAPVRLFNQPERLVAALAEQQALPAVLVIGYGFFAGRQPWHSSLASQTYSLGLPCVVLAPPSASGSLPAAVGALGLPSVAMAPLSASGCLPATMIGMTPEELKRALPALLKSPKRTLGGASAAGPLHYGSLSFYSDELRLDIAGQSTAETLSWKEARLLKLFMQQPQQCLPRATIKAYVWGETQVSPRTIDSQISRLRRRLAPHGISIENVYGDGYIFA